MVRTRSKASLPRKRWSNDGAEKAPMDVMNQELTQKAK